MICPTCHQQNPEGAAFCGKCGAALHSASREETPFQSTGTIPSQNTVQSFPVDAVSSPVEPRKAGKGKKARKAGKKRKWPVVLALAFLFAAAAAWLGVSAYGSHLLEKALPASPFTFTGSLDSERYVSQDFIAGGDYNLPKAFGKLHWSCRSESVQLSDRKDGSADADVTRPEKPETVKVFVTCRYLFGMARKAYTLELVPKPSLTVSSVKVPDESRFNNGKITAHYDEAGKLDDLCGDLGDVTVCSAEDAETVAKVYSAIMSVPDEYDLICENVDGGTSCTFYQICAYLDGYPVMGDYVTVVTDGDQRLFNVKQSISSDVAEPQTDRITMEDMDEKEILALYAGESGREFETFCVMDPSVFYFGGTLVHGYYAIGDSDGIYNVLIEAETGTVVYCELDQSGSTLYGNTGLSLANSLLQDIIHDKNFYNTLQQATVKGYTEYDTDHEHQISLQGAYHPALMHYYLIDQHRGIYIERSNDYVSAGLGWGDLVSSMTQEFSDSVSVESLKWIQDAYDWYYDSFGYKDSRLFGIHCLTNSQSYLGGNLYDNASCDILCHFHVSPKNEYSTTVAAVPAVMYHEYTHSIVNRKHPFTYFWPIKNEEKKLTCSSIGEAYADIFGYWIAEDTQSELVPEGYRIWAMGPLYASDGDENRIYLRNSIYGTGSHTQFPALYTDYQGSDGHSGSVYISNVAYRMYTYGSADCGISKSAVQDIWYDSIGFGFMAFEGSGDISVIRRNVLKAARLNGCTDDQIRYIEDLFYDVGIRDGQQARHSASNYLSGRFVEEGTNLPIEGVKLQIISGNQSRTVYTDAFGGFAVTGVPFSGCRIEYNAFGETGTLRANSTQFNEFSIRKGDNENAYVIPDEDEEQSADPAANDALAATDPFVVSINNPLKVFFTRKLDVTVHITREYSDSFKDSLKSELESNLMSSGQYSSVTVTIKTASKRMISQIDSGDLPHGMNAAVPDADSIRINSFGEWWHYVQRYLGMLTRIQFYVRGTGELMALR